MDESKGQAGGVLTPVARQDCNCGAPVGQRDVRIAHATWCQRWPTPAAAADHPIDQENPAPGWYWICGTATGGRTIPALLSLPECIGGRGIYYQPWGSMSRTQWNDSRHPGAAPDEWDANLRIVAPIAPPAASPAAAAGVPTVLNALDVLARMGLAQDTAPAATFLQIMGERDLFVIDMRGASPVAPAGAPTEERILLRQARDYIAACEGYEPSVGDRSAAQHLVFFIDRALGSQGEQHDSPHEAAPQSSVPSAAPRSSLSETDDSALPRKLWLWKNFVGGRPEFWAFEHLYPVHMGNDDPQTLGEPCGYVLLKPSRPGRTVCPNDELRTIARASTQLALVGAIEQEFVRLEDLPAFIHRLQDEVRASRAAQGKGVAE